MADIQIHRGPDAEGSFFDDAVGLVSRRLSIIDLEGGNQPMSNEDGSIWVIFNGEIYNFLGLREELVAHGHRFRSRSDTEVIVHAYEEWGEGFPTRLNGMYAIAVWDANARALLLVRDRLGIKPLYYARLPGGLLFASELKALLLHPEVPRDLDGKALAQFLSRRFPLGDRTPFQSIRRLLPGSTCRVTSDRVDFLPFWQVPDAVPSPLADATHMHLRRALEDSVRRQLISDVPLGIALSGGLDSSSLTALAKCLSQDEVTTFTAGFGEDSDEIEAARRVAEHVGTRHQEVMISYEEMTVDLPDMMWNLDEPIADPAILPTYQIMKFGQRQVKVVLVGEGADELFGGYSHYRLGAPPFSFAPLGWRQRVYHGTNLLFSASEQRSLLKVPQLETDPSLLDPAFERLPFAEAMMRSELKNVLPCFQLHRVDRMSMAHSLEARVPYLDDVVLSAAFGVPPHLKVRASVGKVALRQAMKDLLPPLVLRRRKRLFGVPLRRWLSETFGDALETILDTSEFLHSAFREDRTKALLDRSTWQRSERAAYRAWMLAMLDLWHRTFVERTVNEIHQPVKPLW